MNKSCKLCWAIVTLSLAAVVVMAWMFVIRGNVTASNDGRTAIVLSGSERDLVLAEMRVFLESVQAITAGIAEKDVKAVEESARASGMAEFQGVPVSLMSKLPLEFKALGRSTHEAFDDIAREARDMGDEKALLSSLGEMMLKCTSCHAAYRLEVETAK